MKLSTRKILGLDLALVVVMLGLALLPVTSVLREYLQIAVLVAALSVSMMLCGWARPRGREVKIVAIVVLLAAVVFEVLYWTLLGLKCGFVANIYGWNGLSLVQVFLPMTLLLVLVEVLRGQMIERGKGSRLAIMATTVALTLVEVLMVVPTYRLVEARGWFDLIITVATPAMMTNILLTGIAYMYDYRINIGYRLITVLPFYMMPILPDTNQYLKVLFQTILVIVLALGLVGWQRLSGRKGELAATEKIRKAKQRPLTKQQLQRRKMLRWVGSGLVAVVVIAYAALMSGLFKYHFLAIGSGSMEPNLYRGDMILVKKSQDYDRIQAGDVLVYHHSNATIVHRVAEVKQREGKYYYQTQGDANASKDAWEVEQGDVIGVAKGRIVAFGYPTLWLNELFNGGKI